MAPIISGDKKSEASLVSGESTVSTLTPNNPEPSAASSGDHYDQGLNSWTSLESGIKRDASGRFPVIHQADESPVSISFFPLDETLTVHTWGKGVLKIEIRSFKAEPYVGPLLQEHKTGGVAHLLFSNKSHPEYFPTLEASEWRDIAFGLGPASPMSQNPRMERNALAGSLARFEAIIENKFHPHCHDKGSWEGNELVPNAYRLAELIKDGETSPTLCQIDCIEETRRSLMVLTTLERQGRLEHHTVVGTIDIKFGDGNRMHRAVLIKEKDSGEEFVVDSWIRDGGEPVVIMPIVKWVNAARHSFRDLEKETKS